MQNIKIHLKHGQRIFLTSDTHYSHNNICRGVSHWNPKKEQPKGSNDGFTRDWDEFIRSTRDFKNLDQMNDTIVNKINNVVGVDDILIHLGDWSFGGIENIWNFRKRINCKNIYLTLGNHDHHIRDNKTLPNCFFDNVDNIVDNPVTEYKDTRDLLFSVEAQDLFKWVGHYGNFEIVYPTTNPNQKSKRVKFITCHYPIASWDEMKRGRIMLHGHNHLSPQYKIHQGKSMDVGVDGNGFTPYDLDGVLRLMQNQPIKNTVLDFDHHI